MSTIEHPVEFYEGLVIVDEKKSKKVANKRTKKATEIVKKETSEGIKQEPKATETSQKVSKKIAKVGKKVNKIKMSQYNSFDLDTCFEMAKTMGVDMSYYDYTQILIEDDNLKKAARKIVKKFNIEKKYTFEDYGFDEDLIEVICSKVLSTMTITASDFKSLGEELKSLESYEFGNDAFVDNESYKNFSNTMHKVLMLAQRKEYYDLKGLKKFIKMDAETAFVKFTQLANNVLNLWQMADVKNYESFIYSILSQFNDLYEKYEFQIMMDICDLYIIHGELKKGNRDYEYVIRESKTKDYPYYRYASIYQKVDLEYSKEIAKKSISFIAEDSQYYPRLNKIIEE